MADAKNPRIVADPQGEAAAEQTPKKEAAPADGKVRLKPNPRIWPSTAVEIDGTKIGPNGLEVSEEEANALTSHKDANGIQLAVRA